MKTRRAKGIQRVEFLSNKLLSITNLNHGLDILELAQKKKVELVLKFFLEVCCCCCFDENAKKKITDNLLLLKTLLGKKRKNQNIN